MFALQFIIVCVAVTSGAAIQTTSHLTEVHKNQLKVLFETSIASKPLDINCYYFAVKGLGLLGYSVPKEDELCKTISSMPMDDNLEIAFRSSMLNVGFNCKFVSKKIPEMVDSALSRTDVSTADLYHSLGVQVSAGNKMESASTLAKKIVASLKVDDSISSLGYAFAAGALLPAGSQSALSLIIDRVEDAIVQADEVDGDMLQFESGLAVTRMVLVGTLRLADKFSKTPLITKEQAIKFSNYVLNFRTTSSPELAFYMLECLSILSNNKYTVPVVISPLQSSIPTISLANPILSVSVTDLMGKPIESIKEVSVDSVKQEESLLMSKSTMKLDSKRSGIFQFDLMSGKPQVGGFYDLTLSGKPSDKAKVAVELCGYEASTVRAKVVTAVDVSELEIGVVDSDQVSKPRLQKVYRPNRLSQTMKADNLQKLIVKFKLNAAVIPQQVFVRFAHKASGSEVIHLAELNENSEGYSLELDVVKLRDFDYNLGTLLEVHLYIGDAFIVKPISWHVANLDVQLKLVKSDSSSNIYKAKPEIRHVFRKPEARPSQLVSNIFTIVCLLPFCVMFAYWMFIRVNISNFPLSQPAAFGFHAGLISIFCLYACFWLKLNMFTTIKYLICLSLFTFMCGNKLLVHLAAEKR